MQIHTCRHTHADTHTYTHTYRHTHADTHADAHMQTSSPHLLTPEKESTTDQSTDSTSKVQFGEPMRFTEVTRRRNVGY